MTTPCPHGARYRGNKICPDKRTNKQMNKKTNAADGQAENMTLLLTLFGGIGIKKTFGDNAAGFLKIRLFISYATNSVKALKATLYSDSNYSKSHICLFF